MAVCAVLKRCCCCCCCAAVLPLLCLRLGCMCVYAYLLITPLLHLYLMLPRLHLPPPLRKPLLLLKRPPRILRHPILHRLRRLHPLLRLRLLRRRLPPLFRLLLEELQMMFRLPRIRRRSPLLQPRLVLLKLALGLLPARQLQSKHTKHTQAKHKERCQQKGGVG